MFNNLTYKQKFLATLLGFVLLFMASYKKTLKHTLTAKKQLHNVEAKLLDINSSYSDIYALKNEVKVLDNIIGGYTLDPGQVQQKILDFITKKNSDTNVVSIEDVHLYNNKEFLVYTNQIELEGSYDSLIKMLYEIEKKLKDSKVVSSEMYSKKEYRTNTTKLFLKIILQNYEKI